MPVRHKYNLADLGRWSQKIEEILDSWGIDYYPQEFELVDYRDMLRAQVYLGIPTFYPHWSFGRDFELTSTMYGHGLQGLPYELVINSDPCLAYLMKDNDLAMQILTMSHVYWHNNFFKNNCHFRRLTDARKTLEMFREAASIIRGYAGDPTIGRRAVENCITAAHALKYQCRDVNPSCGPGGGQDLLSFLVDNSPRDIKHWERTIVDIVIGVFEYFRPQMMTKIMNEGWASFGHYRTFAALKLPPDLRTLVGQYHAGVVRMPDDPSSLNPYFVGFELWEEIERNFPGTMKTVMMGHDDQSFVEKFLSFDLAEKLGLFLRGVDVNKIVVGDTIRDGGFDDIKGALVRSLGLGKIPVVIVKDTNSGDDNCLILEHVFDGRNLERDKTTKTLEHVYYFWPTKITLETKTYKRNLAYIYQYDGRQHSGRRKDRLF